MASGSKSPVHTVCAPARIDLAGGTLDIWPICVVEPDAVTVNLGIDRFATATARLRRDGKVVLVAKDRGTRETHADRAAMIASSRLALHRAIAAAFAPESGIEITTRSGVPAGSGLGGSSTLVVAMLRAVAAANGTRMSAAQVLRTARDIEAGVLGVPTGCQDHVGALYGGLSEITYPPGGTRRRAIRADLDHLRARLVLAYTGVPHDSAVNNWRITRDYIEKRVKVRRGIGRIADASRAMRDALAAGDLDAAGDAMAGEWAARKALAPGVTTPGIEKLGRLAAAEGARAMKVCGAGGGGCVVLWANAGRRAAVARAAAASGAKVLRFRPTRVGAHTSE